MKVNCSENESHYKLYEALAKREKLEQKALASLTSDVLKNLNINIEKLPQKSQNILGHVAESQSVLGIENLDAVSISLHRSREISDKLADEYEILKLKQKNAKFQAKINRNNRSIEELRKELESSRISLASQNPNPENTHDHIKQLKQKLVSYEENYEKAKSKYAVLAVPEAILPKSLTSQVTSLLALQEEASALKQRADDFLLMKEARDTFSRLRR
ncbi:uncharacterized protein LOC126778291 [Nymphalis io]|uniref:uncharacterized protein LOC126778290 n=1 Tax=Inachis io TaxID=171585 RepID=UPI002168C86F|nr:uncharacterized protein LOC126778290 [Nymphalis io]XP_050357744.1 uncharacterized protein LOC126778291 [Nymphalis io]